MKIQIVLAFLAFLALSTPAQSQHFCGRNIAETLARYCQSGASEKRSASWMRTQIFGAGYWLTPQQAVGMGRGKRQRGIATECCENSCSIDELLAYCPE